MNYLIVLVPHFSSIHDICHITLLYVADTISPKFPSTVIFSIFHTLLQCDFATIHPRWSLILLPMNQVWPYDSLVINRVWWNVHCIASRVQPHKSMYLLPGSLWILPLKGEIFLQKSDYSGTIQHEWSYLGLVVNGACWEQNCNHLSPNVRQVHSANLDRLDQFIH